MTNKTFVETVKISKKGVEFTINTEAAPNAFREQIMELLNSPTTVLSEFLTGTLSGGVTDNILITGRLVQAIVKKNLLTQLGREIQAQREKGRIKEDYFATNKTQASLLELLKFIDSNDTPDEEVFKAMKAIFFSGVATDSGEQEEQLAYQLSQICKQLNSLDITILKACYKVYTQEDRSAVNAYEDWKKIVAQKIGHNLGDLVAVADTKLVELSLLSGRTYADLSGIRQSKQFRLTSLSIKMFQVISDWNDE